jgi:hypothetical protein
MWMKITAEMRSEVRLIRNFSIVKQHNNCGSFLLAQQLWYLVDGTTAAGLSGTVPYGLVLQQATSYHSCLLLAQAAVVACCWHNSCGSLLLAQRLW